MSGSLGALLLSLALSSTSAASFERGVALGLFSGDEQFDYAPLVAEIAALGASHLSIAVVWWQQDSHSNTIEPIPTWSSSDRQLEGAISAARARGLHVTVLPILRLVKAGPGEWRGRIAPEDEDAWWESYRRFIRHIAALSARAGADRLSVGSELLSREAMRDRWIDLIETVRIESPRLELLYSANWDHFAAVSFWDAVDVVGLTAYWELASQNDASIDALVHAWGPVKKSLGRFSAELGRPLVITEIGYPSIDGGTRWPWDQTRRAPIDLEEQRRGYQGFVDAWSGVPFLAGAYFWNWFGFGGPDDGEYTPRNKPAAEVMRRWFDELRRRAAVMRRAER